jgi:hypothetical protein
MRDQSKRIRSNRDPASESRSSAGESVSGRIPRRGSTVVAEERPVLVHRRGSSDSSRHAR